MFAFRAKLLVVAVATLSAVGFHNTCIVRTAPCLPVNACILFVPGQVCSETVSMDGKIVVVVVVAVVVVVEVEVEVEVVGVVVVEGGRRG